MQEQLIKNLSAILGSNVLELRKIRHSFWVRFVSGGCSFVSVKTYQQAMIQKKEVNVRTAAITLRNMIGDGRVWDKKAGEARLYLGKKSGYLRIAPETESSGQVQFFLKSYEIAQYEEAVNLFNDEYVVIPDVDLASTEKKPVLIQEDEDGVIAPEGFHEPGVYIVREWIEYR